MYGGGAVQPKDSYGAVNVPWGHTAGATRCEGSAAAWSEASVCGRNNQTVPDSAFRNLFPCRPIYILDPCYRGGATLSWQPRPMSRASTRGWFP